MIWARGYGSLRCVTNKGIIYLIPGVFFSDSGNSRDRVGSRFILPGSVAVCARILRNITVFTFT